jgi:hypothetical protein
MAPVRMRQLTITVAALLALVLCVARFRSTIGDGPFGVDGGYYYQVARNFAEGRGFVTSVDLYQQGLRVLPARTNIYPLWPLALATAARISSLQVATEWLPRLLYLASVALLFILMKRLQRAEPAWNQDFYSPLLVTALFATNSLFFRATTAPYTEGLGFTLTFLALIALSYLDRADASLAVASGVLAGAAFLTRSQMLFLIAGMGAALAISPASPRQRLVRAMSFAAGAGIAVGAWLAWVATFARPFSLSLLWANYHDVAAIPTYQQAIELPNRLAYALDRAAGLLVMFDPWSEYSFVALFGAAAFLLPIAIVIGVDSLRTKRTLPSTVTLALILAGAGMCGILLLSHQRYYLPWLFGWRHGLALILLLAIAVPYLMNRGSRLMQIVTVLLCLVTIIQGTVGIVAIARAPRPRGLRGASAEMIGWINQKAPNATIISTEAQSLAPYTHANFRWIACDTPREVTFRMLTLLDTDLVVVSENEKDCAFHRGLGRQLSMVAAFGRGSARKYLFQNRIPRVVH